MGDVPANGFDGKFIPAKYQILPLQPKLRFARRIAA
jgi:hypothetical protein